jgi:threonine/homoserine/homoserine lactone efflux protein
MNYELLTALMVFAFVSSITPGPNNLMLMSSGANFGFRRTVPHMLGVGLGFVLMVIVVGVGLMRLFDIYPPSYDMLKVVSVLYLLYLSFKMATATDPIDGSDGRLTPFSFVQAVLFQWINPKAWTMALTAISVYAPSHSFVSVAIVAGIFGAINLPAVSVWTVMGQQLRRVLTSKLRLRAFNVTMAVLLLTSLYPVVV